MSRELVVDSHVHVISPDRSRYPLRPGGLPGSWYLERPVSAPELRARMREAGVTRAVLVQAVGAYSFENAYAVDAAESDPEHFRAAVALDAHAAEAPARLAHWVRERGGTSVRIFALAEPGASWLADPATSGLWEAARALGITAIATVFEHQLAELAQVLERFPALCVALDHCGFPDLRRPDWQEHSPLASLARFPNVYLKVSSHLLHSAEEAGWSGQRLVAALAERFGAGRLIWGSDFPQTAGSYAELVALGRRAFAQLPAEARERALGANALALWFNRAS